LGFLVRSIVIAFDTIPPEGSDARFSLGAEEANQRLADLGYGDVRLVGDLQVEARVTRSGRDVFVIGSVAGHVAIHCVRCLTEFEMPIGGDFHLDLALGEVARDSVPGEMELKRADLEVDPYEGDSVDLAATALEQAMLFVPDYPLCKEGCKGLCPRCGADLNREVCSCTLGGVDSRLAALEKLKTGK
jgi:uncharacterized protein